MLFPPPLTSYYLPSQQPHVRPDQPLTSSTARRSNVMYDRPAVQETASASIPSLNLNGFPSQVAGHISNPPRLSNHAVRMRPPRRSNRPSTAPSKEDVVLLPSLSPTQSFTYKDSVAPSSLQTESSSYVTDTLSHLQTVNEDDVDVCSGSANSGTLSFHFNEAPLTDYYTYSRLSFPSVRHLADYVK